MPTGQVSNSVKSQLLDLPVERLIACSRLVLAGFGFSAIYIDPTQPALYSSFTYSLLAVFLLYSLLAAILSFLAPIGRFGQVATYLIDIGIFSSLMHLTEGPTSPFFVFFTFAHMAATLRWNWHGAILTTGLLIALLVLISVVDWQSVSDVDVDSFDSTRLIMRGIYLIVAGFMFGYVGAFRERSRERLIEIAAWPSEQASHSVIARLDRSLSHTAEVARVGRVLVVWEEVDEPFLNTAIWTGTRYETRRLSPGSADDFVAPALKDVAFMVDGSSQKAVTAGSEQISVSSPCISPILAEQFRIDRAVTAPIASAHFQGRIFLLDLTHPTDDLIAIARIAASRIEIELEHHRLRGELKERAALEERMRVAHDIHDGALQALTAIGFRLKHLPLDQIGELGERLEDLRLALADQQRRLRIFVEEAFEQPWQCRKVIKLGDIRDQLLTTTRRQWDCDLEIKISPEDAVVPRALGDHLSYVLAEAVANAVRHGRATRVTTAIYQEREGLHVQISDNGSGLEGVTGTFDGAALADREVGSRSIRKRVDALRGRLYLSSSSRGLTMAIEIPEA